MFTRTRRTAVLAGAAALSLLAGCASSGSGEGVTTPPGSSQATHSAAAPPTTSTPPTSTSPATPPAASFPVTVHAANGAVTIDKAPTAIVSLSPTATETLYAIGAGAQVVAVDKNSDYPAGLPSNRIDYYHLNVEALTNFHPDLVVVPGLSPAQLSKFKTLGITVVSEPAAQHIDEVYDQINQLGAATGHADKAAALVASMKQQVAKIVAEVPKRSQPLTYYWEVTQDHYSVTSSTFIGQLLKLLGLTSIADAAQGAAAANGYPQLNAEFILKAKPDYIFLADAKCCQQNKTTVAKRPGWSALPAVQDGRVISLNDDVASRWGPRTVDLLSGVAEALKAHPVTP